jgi:hypothetical protein
VTLWSSFASLGGAAGAIVAMAQAWYVGPVAAHFGGDMGCEFAAVFAGVLYPPLRYLEIRIWKRWYPAGLQDLYDFNLSGVLLSMHLKAAYTVYLLTERSYRPPRTMSNNGRKSWITWSRRSLEFLNWLATANKTDRLNSLSTPT